MRSLRQVWLWASAGWLAITILRRMFRGEVVVLSAHAAPVVRLVAIVLVFLAGCAEKLKPQAPHGPQDMSQEPDEPAPVATPVATPVAAPEPPAALHEFPAGLDDAALARAYRWSGKRNLWAFFAGEDPSQAGAPRVSQADPEIAAAVDEFVAKAAQHVERLRSHEAETAVTLVALLDAVEAFHLYDVWLAAHLWQHARTLSPASPAVLSRIERHLRVCNALALAEASTGPVEFSAWRSKAGPPRGWTGLQVPPGLTAAARAAFAGADAGTWDSQAVVTWSVARGEPVLLRRGAEQRLAAGASLRLRRLDLVRAPAGAALRHPKLGEIVLPVGAELSAWKLGEFVTQPIRDELRATLRRAQAGDAAALAEVEALVPALHTDIRQVLTEKPDAPGAPGLRLVLANFDE